MRAGAVTIPIDVAPVEIAQQRRAPVPDQREVVFGIRDLSVSYGPVTAISGVDLDVYRNLITAVIAHRVAGRAPSSAA